MVLLGYRTQIARPWRLRVSCCYRESSLSGSIFIIEDDLILNPLLWDWLQPAFPDRLVVVVPYGAAVLSRVEAIAPRVILVNLDTLQTDALVLIDNLHRELSLRQQVSACPRALA